MKIMLAVTVGLALGAPPQAGPDPIKLHPDNPHYFLWRENPTVLVTSGEHYGAVLNLDFDYVAYLNALESAGLNLTRTFTGMYLEGWGEPWNTLNPPSGRLICPWARSSTPGYADGGNKFDLNQWDAAYFARLKDFVAQAGSRGIVVEIVLFCVMYGDAQWNLSPLKSANNVNGVGNNVAWDQVLNLSNAGLTAVQDAMTAKIVTELNAYDNVYYELCNEPYFGDANPQWHQHVAQNVVDTEASLPKKHLIAHNIANGSTAVPSPIPAVSIFNFHYSSPPDSVAQNYGLNKVVAFDETGFRGATDSPYRKEAWDFIVAGGAVYDNLDWSFSVASEGGNETGWDKGLGGGGPAIRAQLRILKDFIHGFDFIRMAPANGVIKGGLPGGVPARALVETGKQYAIYLNGGSQSNLVVELPAGNYRAEWVNTKNGNVDRLEDFAHGGGNRTLSSPSYSEDIALRIRNAQGGNLSPGVSLTAPAAGATFAAGADVTLSASASDSDGSVARVEFYAGDSRIGEDASSPYGMTWNDVPAGVYTLTAKAVDDDGAVATSSPVTIAVGATFYRAVNLNGTALTIDGNAWEGKSAPNCSYTGSGFENQAVTLSPPTDANRASMIRSSIWNSAGSNVTLSAVPNGTYMVYLYVWEDNSSQTYDISMEGQVVQAGYSSGPGGHWDRLGPWSANVTDGTINVVCSPADANLSGIEVWTLSASTPPPPPPPPPPTGQGLTGNYFNNMDLTSPVLSREDAAIDFDWGAGSPDPSIGADTFSVRWTGLVTPLYSETYAFTTTSDDGVRLWVAGQLLVNHWDDHGPAEDSGAIALKAGQSYEVVMEYYENGGGAVARLAWSSPSQPGQIIPADRFSSSDPRDNDGDGTSNSQDPDDDNDGIPDLQDDDQDGDGVSNAAELTAGTDPQDSSSTPGSGGGTGVLAGEDGGAHDRCGATGAECLIILGLLGILGRRRG